MAPKPQAIQRDIIELPRAPEGGIVERLGHRFSAVSGMDPDVAERAIQMSLNGETPQFVTKGELASLVSMLADAFKNEADRATTDALTGIKNRAGAEEFFIQEHARVQRGLSKGGVVLFFDLDKFKPINDTFGHEVGDICLKTVANAMCLRSRKSDVPVRLGGDEFVLILTNTTIEQSRAHIDQLFSYINSLSVPTTKGFANILTSVGMTEYTAADTLESALKRADAEMYTNKQMRKAAEAAGQMTQDNTPASVVVPIMPR